MKKATIFILSFLLSLSLFANDSLFSYNKAIVENEFESLNTLEEKINQQGDNFNLSTLELSILTKNKSTNSMLINSLAMQQSPLGVPGFFWGCLLGPIGVLIVAVSDERSDGEVLSASLGCLLSGCLFGGYFWWLPNYYY